MGYYSPAEILLHVLLFIPCRPRLPARAFFVHKKAPPERGWRVALCAIAWCRVPPGEFSPVTLNPRHSRFDNQRLYHHQSPLRSGGFTMPFSFNKFAANRTTFRFLSCEEFNTSHLCAFSTGCSQHHNTSQATEAKCPTTEKTCNYDYCLLQRCRITV